MKLLKNHWLLILLLLAIGLYFLFQKDNSPDYQAKIREIESEKIILKKELANTVIERDKIRKSKDDILKDYEFRLVNSKIMLLEASRKLTGKRKTKIVYRDRVITKTSPVAKIWDFSLNLHSDFENYVKFDLAEREKSDEALRKCFDLNLKSENIIGIQTLQIKGLKKKAKKYKLISIGSVLITGIVLIIK
jgi:hypothetical protein